MSEGELPIREWLSAFVPLGTYSEQAWEPAGAGVLIVDLPVIWLVTAKSLIKSAGDAALAAFLPYGPGGTILDFRESHAESGLSWIEHPELDLCASLFPLSPAWDLKAFPQEHCAPSPDLSPLSAVCSIGCAYGLIPTERPEPFLFGGSLVGLQSPHVYSSAPLLALNVGAPLIQVSSLTGGSPRLAGILTRTMATPCSDPRVSPVALSEAVGMEAVWELVRGEQALAQRKYVAEQEAGAAS